MANRPKTEKLPAARRKRRWIRITLLATALGFAVASIGTLALVLYCSASIDEHLRYERASDYKPKVVTKVYSADGELVGEIYEERRTVVPRQKIPPVMIHAIVDAEDAQFYEHGGLSYWGMLRALLNDLRPGAHMQGASTLTQQLVRNLLLHSSARSGWQGLKRKVQEMILSRRIETKLSKDEILWMYLNQIEFPYQRFGIEEAARFYFGKSVADVDIGEAALLASLPKGPSEIDPWKHPERAKDRQRYVLSQMERYKHITHAEALKYAESPIRLVRTPAPYLGVAPEFVDEVRRVLAERIGLRNLYTMGLQVTTTCDARIQKLAREVLEKQLQNLDERHGYRKPISHLNGAALQVHLKKLAARFPAKKYPNGPPLGAIVEGVVRARVKEPVDGLEIDLGTRTGILPLPAAADRYNPKGIAVDKRFSVGDVMRVSVAEYRADEPPILSPEFGPQAGAVVLDPNTREVKAIVGGYGFHQGMLNHAISLRTYRDGRPAHREPCGGDSNEKSSITGCRQPGSSFKPFVYATAFSTEKFTPATVLIDSPVIYTQPGMQPWKPQNAEHDEYLGPVRLRVALARSLNSVASALVYTPTGGVEPAAVIQLAHAAGIESDLKPNQSLALGAAEVSLLELSNAYGTFAASGRYMPVQLLRTVGNDTEPPATATAVQAMKPELAYLMTSMMTSVIEEGTAASARGKLKRPAAGKTGTVSVGGKHTDAWFVGYTPDLVAGVWVGFDDNRELGRGEQGARAALPIWTDIMVGALKSVPPKPFTQPPGVVVQKIDPKTGLLAPPGASGAIDEVFLDGTAPTQMAPAVGEANPDTYIIDQAQ
jgi:penicillin-binding protein 1A